MKSKPTKAKLLLALALAAGTSTAAQAAAAKKVVPATASSAPKWKFQEAVDPLTDIHRGVASLEIPTGALVVKCDRNGPGSIYVSVVSTAYLGALPPHPKYRPADSRLDSQPATQETWIHGHRSTLISDQPQATDLAMAYASAKRLFFRFRNFKGDYVEFNFTADGDPTAVKRAFATCGQKWEHPAPLATN